MKFDFDAFKALLAQLADSVAQDGLATADAFWSQLQGSQIPEAKAALRRYGENNLDALRHPDRADEFHKQAAHNLNTLVNLGAANHIAARREARKYLERVMAAILDAASDAIDVLL